MAGIVVEGFDAVESGVDEEADIHDRYIGDNRGVRYSRLERDPPQDGDNEPVGAWIPRS